MSSSTITFDNESEQFILLQLSPDLLNERITIKPVGDASTVLCTSNATYQLKDVQQSNLLLFLHSANSTDATGLTIRGEAKSWLETTKINPNVVQLLKQLPDYSGQGGPQGIPREVLFASIPASEAEIENQLQQHMCIHLQSLGGYVRLDYGYACRLIHVVINSILAAGLSLEQVDPVDFLSAIEDEEDEKDVLTFILRRFSNMHDGSYRVDPEALVAYIGDSTLREEAIVAIPIDDFRDSWQRRLPKIFIMPKQDLPLDSLRGSYISPTETSIVHLDTHSLSVDPKTRISQLLKVQPRWSESDIRVYLGPLVSSTGQNLTKAIDSMIMKFARKVKVGKQFYIERRGE